MNQLLQREASDSKLIYAAQQEQDEGFDQLYEHFYQNVFSFIYARMQNWQDAEDLTQEVFMRTWINIHKFQDQGIPFNHYLFRIAHNIIIDFHRRNKRMMFVEDLDINWIEDSHDEIFSIWMDLQHLTLALKKLPDDYRKVLVLRFMSGLTPKETAKFMNRTEVATRILQHRALVAIREIASKDQTNDC